MGIQRQSNIVESRLIANFLYEKRDLIRLRGIERAAVLPNAVLSRLIKNDYRTLSFEDIDKVMCVLNGFGFYLPNINPMARITHVICAHFGIKNKQLMSNTRRADIVEPRQIAMYFCRNKITPTPKLVDIGTYYGGKKHDTVLYSCRMVETRCETEKYYSEMVKEIECKISL